MRSRRQSGRCWPSRGGWPLGRELRLGFDTSAGLLETVVLVFQSGDEMVFRAMPVGKKYLDLLP